MFDTLQNSLISLGQLCDDNCTVVLTKDHLLACKDDHLVLQGKRSISGDGLWDIPLCTSISSPASDAPAPPYPQRDHPQMNVIIRKDKAKSDLVRFLHGACFYPTKSTWLNAIRQGFFVSWPGLTEDLVKNHLPPSLNIAKGHLQLQRKLLLPLSLQKTAIRKMSFWLSPIP